MKMTASSIQALLSELEEMVERIYLPQRGGYKEKILLEKMWKGGVFEKN